MIYILKFNDLFIEEKFLFSTEIDRWNNEIGIVLRAKFTLVIVLCLKIVWK